MNVRNFERFILLIVTTSLLNACNINQRSGEASFNNDYSSLSSLSFSSFSHIANESSSDVQSKSSSSSKSEFVGSSSEKELSSNSQTCSNHIPQEEIVKTATIINKGIKRATCPNCGGFTESYYYDLDEFEFADTTYQYDGEERELLIKGLLPYGTHVEYENNKLTDIGEKT
ncbi:MAG: hypothetical protein J5617_03600, partial [Bacilli bacterium]|nr:hypothetical protein [Bacilli bacterium]